MRTIDAFPRHEVRRLARHTRTAWFARDARLVVWEIVELIADVRLRNANVQTGDNQKRSWVSPVVKLCGSLLGPAPVLRVYDVMSWYAQQPSWRVEPKIPRVDSGQALLEKFVRLEDAMLDRRRVSKTTDEVVTELFNGSRIEADAFRSDVIAPARKLRLGDVSESELSSHLGLIYAEIRRSVRRGGPEPMDLLSRYVGWLGDRNWDTATVRVLTASSPAFQNFLREEAARDPYGLHPFERENYHFNPR